MKKTIILFLSLIIIGLLGVAVALKVKLDVRDKNVQSLRLELNEWDNLIEVLPKGFIEEFESNYSNMFIVKSDTIRNQILLEPKLEIDNFYGFLIEYDSMYKIRQIEKFKP